ELTAKGLDNTVSFLGCTGPEGSGISLRCQAVDRAAQTTLARIGLVAAITDVPRVQMIQTAGTRPFNYDLSQLGWFADYPDPQGMLQSLLDGRLLPAVGNGVTDFSYFNDSTVNSELDTADANTDPTARFNAFGLAEAN